jgi:hypothetical protein
MKTLADTLHQQEILNRIAKLSSRDEAKWGRMSVHQMICHLDDSYRLALGEKNASPATGPLQRTIVKWVALRTPLPWKKGFPTRPEVEQGKGGSAPGEFEADRNALRLVLCRFCQSLPQPCLSHPVFGPMESHDWWRWGYLHADHHLRQFGR